ncbi:MAG: S46 family peptidase, partial [Ginsengibacter sp.]
VYTSPSGKPAEYSPENIPLKPKWFLPVSLRGYKDGDYSMIYGYPGGTNRYETSYGIKLKNEIDNPSLVNLRDVRLKAMYSQMIKDPAVKLKLADSYSGIANYYKFYKGETEQLEKYHVYENKQADEKKFATWAAAKPDFKNILEDYAANYAAWTPYAKMRVYTIEGILGSPLTSFATTLSTLERALVETGKTQSDVDKAVAAATSSRQRFLESEDIPSDRIIMAKTAQMYYNDIDKNEQPAAFYDELREKFGPLNDDATFKKWADYVFDNTMILDSVKWNAFVAHPDAVTLQSDPAFSYASTFLKSYMLKYSKMYSDFSAKNNELGRLYLKGIMEMNPGAVKKMYPDANFSMRVSYGNVKSYNPRDAVHYNYFTTSKGILEKYKPGDYEFDLPSKEIDLLKKRDFGQYIDKKQNDLIINFITTNDITGGNSGSPVMDAYGNLIGLAFDGNYEALSHKIQFDKDLNRTICVDVRYVLWCIDKMGGATNIINELKLVR